MIIGCTGNYRKNEYLGIVKKINSIAENIDNVKIIVSDDLKNRKRNSLPDNLNFMRFDKILNIADIIFAIGGDGTIISTVRRMKKKQKPILGVHIGRLGFLSECTGNDIKLALDKIYKGSFHVSERMILKIIVSTKLNKNSYFALNDIVFTNKSSVRLSRAEVYVSSKYLNTYEGDGLIISTPTGSTAYSLSAGGPIISPDLDIITVTPICPHSLSARPIVLKSAEMINVKFSNPNNGVLIAIDGQVRVPIKSNEKLTVSKANHSAQLIRFSYDGYFNTLRNKMGWSGNVR